MNLNMYSYAAFLQTAMVKGNLNPELLDKILEVPGQRPDMLVTPQQLYITEVLFKMLDGNRPAVAAIAVVNHILQKADPTFQINISKDDVWARTSAYYATTHAEELNTPIMARVIRIFQEEKADIYMKKTKRDISDIPDSVKLLILRAVRRDLDRFRRFRRKLERVSDRTIRKTINKPESSIWSELNLTTPIPKPKESEIIPA